MVLASMLRHPALIQITLVATPIQRPAIPQIATMVLVAAVVAPRPLHQPAAETEMAVSMAIRRLVRPLAAMAVAFVRLLQD